MTQARYYSSTATSTTLSGSITNVATTMTVGSVTGFPASLPYTLILERDTANEEVVTVTAAAGTTLTVTRGADGTAAVSHTIGAKVEHGVSARDFSEPQAHIAASSAVHGLTGSVVGTSDSQTLTNKILDGAVLDAASTLGGVSGTSLAADRTAWTVDTAPTVSNGTNWTLAAGSYQRYKQIGKTVYVELWAKCGADNSPGAFIWTLPVEPRDITQQTLALGVFSFFGSSYHIGVVTPSGTSSQTFFWQHGGTSNLGQGDGLFAHNGDVLSAQLVYEAA